MARTNKAGFGLRLGATLFTRLAVLAALLPLAGCLSDTGDFGRPKSNSLSNLFATQPAGPGAFVSGAQPSHFPLTEDEKELRARAWNFFAQKFEASAFEQRFGQLHFVAGLPSIEMSASAYHDRLMRPGFTSLVSRYQRLRHSIENDHALIAPFRLTAVHVRQADSIRERALETLSNVTAAETSGALARICENAAIIAHVHRGLFERSAQYRYALERLVIEGPEREAIGVERSLVALDADLAAMHRLTIPTPDCAPAGAAVTAALSARPPLKRKY